MPAAERLAAATNALMAGRQDEARSLLADAGTEAPFERLRCMADFRDGEMAAARLRARGALDALQSESLTTSERLDVLAIGVVAAGELLGFDEALAWVHQVLTLAQRMGTLEAWVRARGTAGVAFALLGDPWAARRLTAELAGLFHGLQADPWLEATVRGNHAATCLQLARMARAGGDDATAAEALEHAAVSIERGREIVAPTGNARLVAFVDVHEAEWRLLRGEGEAAHALLAGAVAAADARGLRAHARQLRLLEAEVFLVDGDAAAALGCLLPVRDDSHDGHQVSTRIRLHGLLHDVHRARGEAEPARAHLDHWRQLEQLRRYRQYEAQARHLRTRLELEHVYRWKPGAT